MTRDSSNPFSCYRWTLTDADRDLLAQLSVTTLVHGAINGTVEGNADARYGRRLFDELDRRGREAWYEAVVLLLDFLAGTPVAGQIGTAAVARLRLDAARQQRKATRLLFALMAEHRAADQEATARIWESAPAAARAEIGRRLFVMTCGDAESGASTLTPEQTRNLSQQLAP